jgi:hypothetical protein
MHCASTFASLALAGFGLAIASAPAGATWSVGADAGLARLDVVCNASTLPCYRRGDGAGLHAAYTSDSGWGLRLAWHRTRGFAGSDVAGGSQFGGALRFDTTELAGTWRTRIAPLEAELRAGVASVDGEFTYAAGGSGTATRRTTQPIIGAALDWPLTAALAVRLDLQATRAEVATTSGRLAGVSLGLVARF